MLCCVQRVGGLFSTWLLVFVLLFNSLQSCRSFFRTIISIREDELGKMFFSDLPLIILKFKWKDIFILKRKTIPKWWKQCSGQLTGSFLWNSNVRMAVWRSCWNSRNRSIVNFPSNLSPWKCEKNKLNYFKNYSWIQLKYKIDVIFIPKK